VDTIFIPAAVTVPGPVADFASTTQLNCLGSTATLTSTSTNAANYLWDFGDGTTSTLANPVHQYNASGANYAITLLATDTNGCTSLRTRTFYAAPDNVVNLSATKGCAGDTVFFNTYANTLGTLEMVIHHRSKVLFIFIMMPALTMLHLMLLT
jgi:PKD repeat protein